MEIDHAVEQAFRVLTGPSGDVSFSAGGQQNGHSTTPHTVQTFVLLPSRKKTRWMIPIGDQRCTVPGLQIYAPNGRRARWLKSLFIAMLRVGWKGFAQDRISLALSQPLTIEALVREVSGEQQPVFSFSLGTPGRFRKVTAQVMRPDGEVIGYIKLPLTAEAAARLQNEAATLELLQRFSEIRAHVPRILYAGPWGGQYLLFQSAGPSESAPIEFNQAHKEFLAMLAKINALERPGKALVEDIWKRWEQVETKLDSNWKALGAAAMKKADRELSQITVPCGISHGDFAPWNTRLGTQGLYVFDWERAELQAPLTWDAFHYHVQTSHLLKRHNLERLVADTPSHRGSCLLYLVNSVCVSVQEIDTANNMALDYRRGILLALLSL